MMHSAFERCNFLSRSFTSNGTLGQSYETSKLCSQLPLGLLGEFGHVYQGVTVHFSLH